MATLQIVDLTHYFYDSGTNRSPLNNMRERKAITTATQSRNKYEKRRKLPIIRHHSTKQDFSLYRVISEERKERTKKRAKQPTLPKFIGLTLTEGVII